MIVLTNREIATLILLGGFLAFAISKSDVRQILASIVLAFFKVKFLIPLIGYYATLSMGIWIAETFGLWNRYQLKDTIVWLIGSGFVIFLNLTDVALKPNYFGRAIRSTVTFGAIYGFFINLRGFSLVVEIVGQFAVAVLSLLIIVPGTDKQSALVKKISIALLGIIALVLTFSTFRVLFDQRHVLKYGELVRSFVLPIWLTILALPCVFILALMVEYETAFIRLSFANNSKPVSRKIKIGLLLALNVHLGAVHDLVGYWAARIVASRRLREAYLVTQGYRHTRALEYAEKQAARSRLVRFAGVAGVDSKGLRLDRREFKETRQALQWLANCHMEWYANHGKRYQKDLLEKLSNFSRYGLPGDHGIEMKVRKDGQAWYAWRRTITGWVFAIGAAKAPPDQWLYDGPTPPRGFPGSDPTWRGPAGSVSPNWLDD